MNRLAISRSRIVLQIGFVAAVLLSCTSSQTCIAETATGTTPESGRLLRVGTSGDYPPFSDAMDEAPGFRGFDVDVASAFARDMGYELAWVRFRWPVLAAGLSTDRFDLAMSGVTVRPDRSALGRFSVPVLESGAVVLFRETALTFPIGAVADGGARAARDLDRPGMTIAVNRGGHLERVARAEFSRAKVMTIPDNAMVREALVSGAVNAVLTDTIEAPVWRKGLDDVLQTAPITQDWKAYWVAPQNEALSRELDAWLLAKERDGTLSRLRVAHFGVGNDPPTAAPVGALLAAIDERLALMPWVAESKRITRRAVEDLSQEERVLAAAVSGVDAAAARADVAPPNADVVRAFYRAQIEAAKEIQRTTLGGPVSREAQGTDLSDVLRPALIRIGDRLAQLVVAVHEDGSATDSARKVRDRLRSHGLSGATVSELERTIDALSRDD